MGRTTVPVRDETWERLNNQKSRGDTFDDVITALLNADDECDEPSAGDVEKQVQRVSEQVTEAEAGGE